MSSLVGLDHALRRPGPSPGAGWLTWLLGLAALPLFYLALTMPSPERLIAILLALVLVVLAVRRPDIALIALIVLLPFQLLILAKLFAWGVPEEVVRPLGGLKDALLIGIVIAGARGFMRSGRRLDGLDLAALAFIGIAALYALAPGALAPGAPSDLEVRILGFRQSAGFVILFLAARHARLPAEFRSKAMSVALGVGVVVALAGIYEFAFPASWNEFVVRTLEFSNYKFQVLEVASKNPFDYRIYGRVGGEEVLRVGSVFIDALACGFYLVVGFAIGIERWAREGARLQSTAALLLIATALLMTQTRSAIIGALVVAILVFRPAAGRRGRLRTQVALLLAAGALMALPAAASTGLSERATSAASGNDPSAEKHVKAFWTGLRSLGQDPLGRGLGTSAGVGQRFQAGGNIAENSYIQVGNELGLAGMLVFIVWTVLALKRLRRSALASADLAGAAIWIAAAGLCVTAFFLHVWIEFPVAWTLWGLAGAALGMARDQPVTPPASESASERAEPANFRASSAPGGGSAGARH